MWVGVDTATFLLFLCLAAAAGYFSFCLIKQYFVNKCGCGGGWRKTQYVSFCIMIKTIFFYFLAGAGVRVCGGRHDIFLF